MVFYEINSEITIFSAIRHKHLSFQLSRYQAIIADLGKDPGIKYLRGELPSPAQMTLLNALRKESVVLSAGVTNNNQEYGVETFQ